MNNNDSIQIYDQKGNKVGSAKRFRWAQYRELRAEVMRYEDFIKGRIWPISTISTPGPYIILCRYMVPDLGRYTKQYFAGVTLDYNNIKDGGIAFKARLLSLVPPLGLNIDDNYES